jgi:hypothetical protein
VGVGVGDGVGVGVGPGGCVGLPDEPAAWLTRTVAFATTTVPVRASAAFAAAVNRTVAVPVPSAGATRPIHGTSLRAVHAQPFGAVTVTASWCSAASTDTVDGDRSYRHGAGACETSTSCCATLIRLRRGVPFGFGSTE